MTTLSTASSFITKINDGFPVPGTDNSTQGFRDNFKNIKQSLDYTDQEVYNIKLNSVVTTNPVNDFNDNIVKQAVFQDCSSKVNDASADIQTGDFTIDYRLGNYQKYQVNSGTHIIFIENWPGENKTASMLLSISTSSTDATVLNFSDSNVYNLSKNNLPITLTGTNPHLFELMNDGVTGNLFVKEFRETNRFTKPVELANYTTSTLLSMVNTQTGSLVFLTSGYNRPAYFNGSAWYVMTGTSVVY